MPWAPDYVDADTLADYIDDEGDGQMLVQAHESRLTLAATAASRAVDSACSGACKRQFGSANGTRTYPVRIKRSGYIAEIDDLMVTAGLIVVADGVTLTVADYELLPVNAAADGLPFTQIRLLAGACKVVITATPWGWTVFPPTVVEATLLQGSRFFTRRVAPFGIAGSPETGSELRLLSRVDPDVQVMLQNYKRRPGLG